MYICQHNFLAINSSTIYFNIMYACSISLGDEVVMTGGGDGRGALASVTRYNIRGWGEGMPSLVTGRHSHGCTRFISGGEQVRHYDAAHKYSFPCPQVLLVTGGWDDDFNSLDSTELLRPGSVWQEITARLPRPMSYMSVSTVDNRVLLFGEWRHC